MAHLVPSALIPATRPPSLRDQIYEKLKTAILSGELAPGSPIVEADLAARVGASRTPVREALRRLEAEGLIEVRGQRGMAVRETDRSESICIFEIREALETLAARRACRNMTAESLARLSAYVRTMHERIDDPPAFEQAAKAFHDDMIDCANGDRLKRMLAEVRGEVQALNSRAIKTRERRIASAAEHQSIVEALCAGDEARVAQATLDHISRARSVVIG